jgi:hypothetical protein
MTSTVAAVAFEHRDCAMSSDTDRPPPKGWRHALGLERPRPGGWYWLRDAHFVIAVLAAVPVWIALGLVAGDRMRLSVTPTALFSLLAVQPVVEELIFRGALQGWPISPRQSHS